MVRPCKSGWWSRFFHYQQSGWINRLAGLVFIGLCLVLLRVHIQADQIEDQVVTWADFNHINYVAGSAGYVYFATTEGITRYNKIEQEWETPLNCPDGIGSTDIKKIWVDEFDEKLFAETSLGLYEYNFFFDRWYSVTELPDLGGNTVHVRAPAVMFPPFRYNYTAEGRIIDPYGRYYSITDILDDHSGTLWIGTWGHGAATAGSSSGIIELLPYGLIQNRVNTIIKHDGQVWVSGAVVVAGRSGLSIYDPADGVFHYIESGINVDFPAVDINCVESGDTLVYIGTPIGLLCMNRELERIENRITVRQGLSDDNVLCLEIVGDSLLVGTQRGLSMVTNHGDSVGIIRPRYFKNMVIYDVDVVDSSIWIATGTGAFRMQLLSGRLQRFQHPDWLLSDNVYEIEHSEDEIWFALRDGVVGLDKSTGDIQTYGENSAGDGIHALAVNPYIVAWSSGRGMSILFSRGTRRSFVREFTVDDGLPSGEVYSLLIDGDIIWIGSDKGLTRFLWNDPDLVD
ncbi:MAG: hypothetical protein U9R56_00415 [candidate division Zixibacteria bacterium]|nr:hypothetical protein [candidate division Zixibacteria bacterium]